MDDHERSADDQPAGQREPGRPEAPGGPERPDDPEASGGAEARGGARAAGLPAVWLRFNCRCPLCRDPVSGQRLLGITDVPADISVAGITASSGTVQVLFHPDGHRAVFDQDWLARYGEPGRNPPPDPRTEDAKRLWSAAGLGGDPPRGSWPRYLADAGYRRACQSAVLRDGLLVLSGVPPDPGAVLEVAASLGYVRETNYGRSSTSGSRPRQPTWPSPASPSPRTRTTRTGTRSPPCSCCTAWTTRPTGAIRVSWTGSTRPPRSARRIPPRSLRSPPPPSPSGTATKPRNSPRPGR